MNDPTRQPGYQFTGLRVVKALVEHLADAGEVVSGELNIAYSDQVKVDGKSVVVLQTVIVHVVDPKNHATAFLRAVVELEGRFQGMADANLEPQDFGNNSAPAILFAFSREWIHKLTSAAQPWPPILLPPVNVHELRKRSQAAAGAAAPKVRTARKARN